MQDVARLAVEALTLDVPDGDAARRLLEDVSFTVPAGTVFKILGPSGCGKSSLLRCLDRLTEPTSGRVSIDGQDAARLPVRELRRRIGMVFQRPVLFPGTIADNVMYGPRLRDDGQVEETGLVSHLLEMVGLPASWSDHPTGQLSGGEMQRVALARSLANEPQVLLLDEPTAALDRSAGARIERLLLDLADNTDLTFIWVTHDLDQARRIGDEGLVLVDGRVVEQGSLAQLLSDPTEELTRLFIDGHL